MKLFCRHKTLEFIGNIYGDGINKVSSKIIYRSQFRCKDCNRYIYKYNLFFLDRRA